ncbi:MAG: DNA methyltransferase [Acidobacteriota bacterium]
MTSPPYWSKREYASGGNGLEQTCEQYMENLLAVFDEVKRLLKATGSFWLNIGDTYKDKGMVGAPWRVALAMIDRQGWILRNDVIWKNLGNDKPDGRATDPLRILVCLVYR